ncbi:hypothetical protein LNTAR_08754 [Lentisphaera araneosa HTCC2155]|uniref:Pyrrolo-quinoline quinone repeat domain-containing protein n=1 Tax=Lentisphaera araneosa HTCC2155 TaxID=313628 RepID=A6DHZ2_9BACT|nr:LamG-like jellyroll fold domain-containing protein [Lentisphaera araneosa]EDM28646.1 hypothetical protein LNTAR_08754 [Lentisphaera araneosa HTCC2155]
MKISYKFLTLLLIPLAAQLHSEVIEEFSVKFNKEMIKGKSIISSSAKEQGKFEELPNIDGYGWQASGNVLSFPKITLERLPREKVSAQAIVSLKEGTKWGSIIGHFQDNGSYEKGWLLGYNEGNFNFAVATSGRLSYVQSSEKFKKNTLYHVAGVYDGKEIKIYINGKLTGRRDLSGSILYADFGELIVGAYKDKDERTPLNGLMISAGFQNKALNQSQIQSLSDASIKALPKELPFDRTPILQFLSPSSAELNFHLFEPMNCHVELYHHSGTKEIYKGSSSKQQKFILKNLNKGYKYKYKIIASNKSGQEFKNPLFELESNVNYAPIPLETKSSLALQSAQEILKLSKNSHGHLAIFGKTSESLLLALAAQSKMQISYFHDNDALVNKLRLSLYKNKLYGSRINAYYYKDLKNLSLSQNIFNTLLLSGVKSSTIEKLVKHVKPSGVLISTSKIPPHADFKTIAHKKFSIAKKMELKGQGQWLSQYGSGNNSTYSGESLNNMSSSENLKLQWIGRPGGDFGIDRNPRMPAPLSANGRLFHQGMNRMAALDAHNGSILWTLEIPKLRRVNIPRDASNWCTDGEIVYTAINDHILLINAKDGKVINHYSLEMKERMKNYEWGFIGQDKDRIYGSSVRPESIYKEYYGNNQWYDNLNDKSTGKVCSESFFALSKKGERLWTYKLGLIINTSICYQNELIYFVETRNPEVLQLEDSRITEEQLWNNQFLVCLNAKSGKVVWEKDIDTVDGDIVFYMQSTDKSLLISLSNSKNKKYYIYNFDIKNGKPVWEVNHNWPSSHHSGHMLHPVIVDNTIYQEPMAYNIISGKQIRKGIGKREGCHNYVGIKQGLVFRGTSRQISIWSKETGKTSTWSRLRPSCWLSMIPASGMLLVPEGGAGCSCGGWIETSLGFSPWETK